MHFATKTLFLAVALTAGVTAQTQLVRGDVDSVSGSNRFQLDCTRIPLTSSTVNLEQLHDQSRQRVGAITGVLEPSHFDPIHPEPHRLPHQRLARPLFWPHRETSPEPGRAATRAVGPVLHGDPASAPLSALRSLHPQARSLRRRACR